MKLESETLRMEPCIVDMPKGSTRNDPCPCGSGKKLKHCCGSGKVVSANWAEAERQYHASVQRESQRRLAERIASNPGTVKARSSGATLSLVAALMAGCAPRIRD